ncbi:polysaccharide biosynthesis C-terminal domain-containing protein [Altererythrobacter sp. ZODW24]|uniref:lipopolysaccharide biosynthesis protein n=1 Tax=Altererythrobacter sp. ZODW24 TaxID=2185142 RepID=UPI0013B395CF|nr:polysaccharide biosynthesis C-terminal domain-containing protein [Altererythrobacter sp. ZODW24]
MSVAAMGYGKLVGALIQLALVPVLALQWGLPLYGQWLMLSAIPVFLAASDFGFSTAAGNRIIAEVAKADRDEALVTFQSAWSMIIGISAVTLVIAAAVVAYLPSSILAVDGGMNADDARTALAILCLYGIISLQIFLFAAVARSEGRQAQSISLIATIQLVEGLSVLAIVWFGGSPLDAAIAYLAVRSAGLLAHVILSKRFARWMRLGSKKASGDRVRMLFRPAFAAMLLPLGQAGFLQGTAIAIGAAGGAAMVPLYTSLRTVSRVGLQIMSTFVIPLMPDFTAAFAQENHGRVARIGGLVAALNVICGVIFGFIIAVFGADVLRVWTGGAIQPPQLMITLTGIAAALAVVWNPLGNLLLAINRHEAYSYVFVIGAALSIGMTYVLVGSMGVSGAAAAGVALEALMLVTIIISTRINIGALAFGRDTFLAILPSHMRLPSDKGADQ